MSVCFFSKKAFSLQIDNYFAFVIFTGSDCLRVCVNIELFNIEQRRFLHNLKWKQPKSPLQIVVLVEGEIEGRVSIASRASWYQLAIFESDFSNQNSNCLLGCAQTPFDLHRADAGRAFVPNTSITKKDSLGLSHNGRILGCHRLSGLCFFDGVLFFCKEQFYVTLRTKKFLHLVFRFTVIRVGCFLFRQQLGIFCI